MAGEQPQEPMRVLVLRDLLAYCRHRATESAGVAQRWQPMVDQHAVGSHARERCAARIKRERLQAAKWQAYADALAETLGDSPPTPLGPSPASASAPSTPASSA